MSKPELVWEQKFNMAARAAAETVVEELRGGGGGPYDPGMEARIAKLESSVGHVERDVADLRVEARQLRADMRQDFRITWGGLMGVALGLAALMAKGFHWL